MRRTNFLVVLCASYICLADCILFNDLKCDVRTRIDTGWVCGLRRQAENDVQYVSFRGIPYAEQPVGELRFKELQPMKPWRHHLIAKDEGPICPQHDELFEHLIRPERGMSEACITVNVHVPLQYFTPVNIFEDYEPNEEEELNRTKKGIPIYVHIHGGGFQVGSGDSDLYGPEYLVSKGIIVITFNYRINVFGFLSLNSSKIPGNMGLRDQVTLLKWVKRNARSFGGDPTEVTLGGQSSGASCVHLLMLSPAAQGLFKRAIIMSGTAIPSYYTTSPVYAKLAATRFLTLLGINSTDPDEIYNKLIQVPLEDILKANSQYQYEAGLVTFTPVVESKHPGVVRMLDDDPINLIKQGRGKNYPLIVGFTSDECNFFKNRLTYIKILQRIHKNPILVLPYRLQFSTPPNVALELANKVMDRYFHGNLSFARYLEVCSDSFFKHPAFKVAEWRTKLKNAAPVYLYRFSYESDYNVVKDALFLRYNGTAHVEDLTYIFRTNAVLGPETTFSHLNRDDKMKDWMTQFVINFFRCNQPSCEGTWHSAKKGSLKYQDIREPYMYKEVKPTKQQTDMIKFFDNLYEKASNMSLTNQPKPPKSKDPALWWQVKRNK